MVSVSHATGQVDTTYSDEIRFNATFSEAIDPDTFDIDDITVTGTSAGISSLEEITPNETKFVVFKTNNTAEGNLISENGSSGNAMYMPGGIVRSWHSGAHHLSGATTLKTETPYLVSARYTNAGVDPSVIRVNGNVDASATNSHTYNDTAYVQIGAHNASGGSYTNSDIAEAIVFTEAMNDNDIQKVESYLAIKYGMILSQTSAQDYLASNGETIWSAELAESYKYGIAGIGRDDAQELDQRISKSVMSDALVAFALDQNFTKTNKNSDRTTEHSADLSYMVWSNDNGGLTFTTLGAPEGRRVLNRKWKIQETGSVGEVYISIPDHSSELPNKLLGAEEKIYLLIDNDDNFMTDGEASREIELTLNGSNWEASVDFANGEYFTIAAETNEFPGSTSLGLQLWYDSSDIDGDFNTGNNAEHGTAINTWDNIL